MNGIAFDLIKFFRYLNINQQHQIPIQLKEPLKEFKLKSISCPFCKSNNITFYSNQTRASDEGLTTNFCCHNCKKKWIQN